MAKRCRQAMKLAHRSRRPQQNRQPVSYNALADRLRDAGLEELTDPRGRRGRRHRLRELLMAMALGLVSRRNSLREVEGLTERLPRRTRRRARIRGAISDTTLATLLPKLSVEEMRESLRRAAKAEKRRGHLEPEGLPVRVASIDGKAIGTTDRWDHDDVQRSHAGEGCPYGLLRTLGAFLVSSRATVCLDRRPIPGDTNEVGSVHDFIEELLEAYRQTNIFDVITADAGLTCRELAERLDGADLGYVLGIKANHGSLYEEACLQLAYRDERQAEACVTERSHGKWVTYRLWRHRTEEGWLDWSHARQVVRIQRIEEDDDGEWREGNRYFVSNLPWGLLSGEQWLELIRRHWRCENNGHWTADVVWNEDRRRTPWTTDPNGLYVLAILRMIAFNVVAVLRAMYRRNGQRYEPPWKEVVNDAYAALTAGRGFSLEEPASCEA